MNRGIEDHSFHVKDFKVRVPYLDLQVNVQTPVSTLLVQFFDPRFVSSGFTLIAAWQNYDLTVKPSLSLVPEEGKSTRRAKNLLMLTTIG